MSPINAGRLAHTIAQGSSFSFNALCVCACMRARARVCVRDLIEISTYKSVLFLTSLIWRRKNPAPPVGSSLTAEESLYIIIQRTATC